MADQGVYAKLWVSWLDDLALQNLDPMDKLRWVTLLTLVKRHGTNGSLLIESPAPQVCQLMYVPDFAELLAVLARLPNVLVERVTTNHDRVTRVTGVTRITVCVAFRRWEKYQSDPKSQVRDRDEKRSQERHEATSKVAILLQSLGIKAERRQRFRYAKTYYTVDFYLPDYKIAFALRGPEHKNKRYRDQLTSKKRVMYDTYTASLIELPRDSILKTPEKTRQFIESLIESRNETTSIPAGDFRLKTIQHYNTHDDDSKNLLNLTNKELGQITPPLPPPHSPNGTPPHPANPWDPDDLWLLEFLQSQTFLDIPPEAHIDDVRWWTLVSNACNGLSLSFLNTQFAAMAAWLSEHKKNKPVPPSQWKTFIRVWLVRNSPNPQEVHPHANQKK